MQALLSLIILVLFVAAAISTVAGAFLVLAFMRDMRERAPPQFRPLTFWSALELVWAPGIPVRTRRTFMFALYCGCLTYLFGVLILGGAIAADSDKSADILPLFFVFCAGAVLIAALALSARIRHRDKLK